jgi:hypothetical protein
MATRLCDLTVLTFTGEDFVDHGLELDILPDLVAYKQLVVETAKALWRARHPERERLPKGFEDGIRLKFFTIESASAAIPIKREVLLDDHGEQQDLFESDIAIVDDAAALIEEAVDSVSQRDVLPDQFPKNVIPFFDDFGRCLRPGNEIRMKSARRTRIASYTPETRTRLVNWTDPFYEDAISLAGEVRQADLDGCSFTLRLDDGGKVIGKFDPQQEERVTEALREHTSRRLHVNGMGRFMRATGRIERIAHVDSLHVQVPEPAGYDSSVRPIWEQIVEIGASVPEEEWAKLPTDLAMNLDHYLCGEG